MTTEEKAKVYLEDLKKAKDLIEKISTELQESEDERIRKELYAVINDLVLPGEQRERFNAWLEKQKEPENVSASTMIPSCWEEEQKEQKPAEWSPTKEQMVALNWAANGMLDNDSPSTGDIKASLRSLYNDLQSKSIRPVEWSDEDEEMIKMILGDLEWERRNTTVHKDIRLYDEKIAWLKSLRPQSKEEQKPADLEKLALEKYPIQVVYLEGLKKGYELGLKARKEE